MGIPLLEFDGMELQHAFWFRCGFESEYSIMKNESVVEIMLG